MLYGFLCGIYAQDFDLEYVYIDGFLNFVRHELASLEGLFDDLRAFSERTSVNIILSISGNTESLPPFMRDMVLQIT